MADNGDLGKEVIAIGKLLGILTGDDSSPTFHADWFKGPVAELKAMGTRLDCLVQLISYVLGPQVQSPPPVFKDAQWFPVPNPATGALTPFHLVMPLTYQTGDSGDGQADASGQVGLGALMPFTAGNLKIEAFVYVPLFSYDNTGAKFIADSTDNPCQLGLYCTATDKFQVTSTDSNGATHTTTFTAMLIDACIFLADQAPTLTLTFKDMVQDGTSQGDVKYTTLQSLLDSTVESWIGEVIVQGSYWLHMYVGNSSYMVGDILAAANFLTTDAQGDYHLSLENLKGDATQIALNFVFAALDALSTLEIPLVTLPGGGIYIVRRANNDGSSDYGLRFAAQVSLQGQSAAGGSTQPQAANGKASPAVDLCLGAWLTGESDADNWIADTRGPGTEPGLSVFALHHASDSTNSFSPGFELASVGVNIKGGAGAPLFDLNGYTLMGAEARALLELSDSGVWVYGFALRLDNVGFPLGPSFGNAQAGGAGSNAVAKNLLSTGNQPAGSDTTSAANPGFSATAAYVAGFSPLLEIFDPQGNKTDLIWFPVQRRLGPLSCQKVGLKVDVTGAHASDPVLGVVFDGGVSLGGLSVYLDQLSVDVRLREAANVSGYSLDLQGLDVSFAAGGVDISGGLIKSTDPQGFVCYDGQALIKAENLGIAALGSYCSLPNNGGTSLFIFAVLNAPIGGPAFFFVTGLMAGFGYNRSLKIPAQDDVQNFPFLSGLVNPSAIGGANPSPQDALAKLEQWVPVERGEYWLAAGLQFTTFEVINTNALLIIEFGKDFVISVLGISTLKQPQVGTPYVYAELDIEVVFDPGQGEIKASAVLAPSSYVLTPQAHLTGGFAFYAWFGHNEHAGDFVFTVGGYHPAFKVPSYYPQEKQLGINWQISDTIAMTGGAYFAITPTAMMAGGGLQVTFADGPLKAWLKAQCDVILFWKPFYLIADASVSVGVSFRIHFLFIDKTLSVEIGADFHLWGPPIGGTVHIDWYIISFTIGFGADQGGAPPLTWEDFKGLLPAKPTPQASQSTTPARAPRPMLAAEAAAPPADDAPTSAPAYLHINANSQGLKSTQNISGMTIWLVRPGKLQLTVGSAIPATTITVTGTDDQGNPLTKTFDSNTNPATPAVGVRQVNGGISSSDYQSTQTITILRLNEDVTDEMSAITACMATTSNCTTQPTGCQAQPVDIQVWEVDLVTAAMPQAMWGEPVPAGKSPNINPDTPTVPGATGVTMSPSAPDLVCTPEMVIDAVFADRVVNADDTFRLPLSASAQPQPNAPQDVDSFADVAQVNSDAVAGKRGALFQALQALGVEGWTNDPLPLMAASPGKDFADEPMEGSPAPGLS